MNERNLKIENQRLRREVAQLKRELEDLRRNKQPDSESKIATAVTETAPAPEKKSFDPFNPVPNDPVFNMLHEVNRSARAVF